jgi:hypothetical protein
MHGRSRGDLPRAGEVNQLKYRKDRHADVEAIHPKSPIYSFDSTQGESHGSQRDY